MSLKNIQELSSIMLLSISSRSLLVNTCAAGECLNANLPSLATISAMGIICSKKPSKIPN